MDILQQRKKHVAIIIPVGVEYHACISCIFLEPQQESTMTCGPFYQHGLTLIPAWISYHMPIKVGMKLHR